MSLDPVPQITVRRVADLVLTAASRASFSSSESVGDSPVVPATTTPWEPFSTRWRASRRAASRSTSPSASNGVTIAVITPWIALMPGSPEYSRAWRSSGRCWPRTPAARGRPTGAPRSSWAATRISSVLAAERGDELDPDRQPLLAPVQRQRDRRLPGDVEGAVKAAVERRRAGSRRAGRAPESSNVPSGGGTSPSVGREQEVVAGLVRGRRPCGIAPGAGRPPRGNRRR